MERERLLAIRAIKKGLRGTRSGLFLDSKQMSRAPFRAQEKHPVSIERGYAPPTYSRVAREPGVKRLHDVKAVLLRDASYDV